VIAFRKVVPVGRDAAAAGLIALWLSIPRERVYEQLRDERRR
jgi:hypothetical protein